MTRSPNYPTIGLPEAIKLAKVIWDKEKRTAISLEQLAKVMGYESLSGPARSKVSAMKKYGLLEKQGQSWKLSDRALTILLKPEITREYKTAIRDAATGVGLFGELFKTHRDASDDTLSHYLIVEKDFTADGAAAFVKAFRATKKLAFSASDGMIGQVESAGTEDNRNVSIFHNFFRRPKDEEQPDKGQSVLPLPILMDDGSFQVIPIPRMTKRAFDFLKSQLDVYQSAIVVPDKPAPQPSTEIRADDDDEEAGEE